MKKICITLILIFGAAFATLAQKQGSKWLFGKQCGVDFSSGVPVAISTGATGTDIASFETQEGTSCISDSAGHLLFYSSGQTVWNALNTIMPNGSGLMGGYSSTQAALIVPFPGSNRFFYVFTTDHFESYSTSFVAGCRYSVVDMCADSYHGDVDPSRKNILLLDTATEKLAAVRDNAGTGYWVMAHKLFSDAFYAWHITVGGIAAPVISHIGTIHGTSTVSISNAGQAQGQMKFSPLGNKVAAAIGNKDPNTEEVFDFDQATGIVSNLVHLDLSIPGGYGYGLEFSPDGTKLYATCSGGLVTDQGLYQFDLTAGSESAIAAAKVHLYTPANSTAFGMQLGPDGKIYGIMGNYTTLAKIDQPNLAGTSAGFTASFITLTGVDNYTLPALIAGYHYSNNATDCILDVKDITDKAMIRIYPNPAYDRFTIECTGDWTAKIIDMTGRTISEFSGNGTTEHAKGTIIPGTYFITIMNATTVENKKLIFH